MTTDAAKAAEEDGRAWLQTRNGVLTNLVVPLFPALPSPSAASVLSAVQKLTADAAKAAEEDGRDWLQTRNGVLTNLVVPPSFATTGSPSRLTSDDSDNYRLSEVTTCEAAQPGRNRLAGVMYSERPSS